MLNLHTTKCHDPRDKMYAALGIAGHSFIRDIRNFIVPDYSASVEQFSQMSQR